MSRLERGLSFGLRFLMSSASILLVLQVRAAVTESHLSQNEGFHRNWSNRGSNALGSACRDPSFVIYIISENLIASGAVLSGAIPSVSITSSLESNASSKCLSGVTVAETTMCNKNKGCV